MNADGTAWHQRVADTRFLSCPDADTRHRPHLIIHDVLQCWPEPATLITAGGDKVYFGIYKGAATPSAVRTPTKSTRPVSLED